MSEMGRPAGRFEDGPMPATDQPRGRSFRQAVPSDASHVAELVNAAYRHYVGRIGTIPGPMTDHYEEVIRNHHVTVAERDGAIEGVIVLRVTRGRHIGRVSAVTTMTDPIKGM